MESLVALAQRMEATEARPRLPRRMARALGRVPGHGALRCDDTPRDDYINGLPHLDLRLATYDAAIRWGARVVEVERIAPPRPPRPPKHWTHERGT